MSNILVGKVLTGISLAKDRQAILFHTTLGDIKVLCDADCCSYTWVEGIELPALEFPATVISVDDISMPKTLVSSFHPGSDVLAYYGCQIKTDRGDIIIDYRNDSNGYYGGNLDWDGSYFYGGVFQQNISKEIWKKLG